RLRGGGTSCGDYRHAPANQVGRQRTQPVVVVLRPAILDRYVLTFDVPGSAQPLAECSHHLTEGSWRRAVKKPNHRHRRLLLCARRERPCGRRAAEQLDEFASLHLLPQPGGHSLPYQWGNAALCITAKLMVER